MLENEKRDRNIDAALEKKEMQHQIENEKRDRDAALENKQMQHQIEQLKLEARIGQMEQQLRHYSQPIVTSSQVQPLQHMVNPSPQQGERQQWQLQQLQELKLRKTEESRSQPQPALPACPSVLGIAPISSPPAGPHIAVATSMQGNLASQSAQPGAKNAMVVPSMPQGSTGSSAPARAQPPSRPKQSTARSKSHKPAATALSEVVQLQHQVGIGPAAKGGSILLPGDASNHFFLSHCQATGGDQTNAIYLELRQLGFSCW
jgi:hypothetical protein